MKDCFGRSIDYLRVSVTDRCNLRCRYCMPPGSIQFLPHEDILGYEELAEVVRAAIELGVTKVRITGGEPLVRRDVARFVEMLASIGGIADLSMSTNGVLLAGHAESLMAAGLQRVNISLDTMNPARFRELSGNEDLARVFAGIEAARQAGLWPIKLNCVVAESSDEEDARDVAAFARQQGLEVRFIHRMSRPSGVFSIVEGGAGGDCARCNRLRLTCGGHIKPCLFSDLSFSVRELGAAKALRMAIDHKPRTGKACAHDEIHAIGG